VTRSFFEFAPLLDLGGHDGESRLSTGRDTCFREHSQMVFLLLGFPARPKKPRRTRWSMPRIRVNAPFKVRRHVWRVSEGSAELSNNFLLREVELASGSRNRVGEPSTRSRARRSSSSRVPFTLHAGHDGLESPNLDGEVRDREVSREALEALRQDFRERSAENLGRTIPCPSTRPRRSLNSWMRPARHCSLR
jgi:hypothetical protein